VEEHTRASIEQAVRDSGYVYHPVPTRRNSIDMVMLILERVDNETYAQESAGISSVFDSRDIMYVGAYSEQSNQEKLESYMKCAIKNRFKGMILFSPVETPAFQRIMQHCSIPCVALNRPLDTVDTDTVCMDNKAAGRMAVEHLISRGHRRIVHLALPDVSSGKYRMMGYTEAMTNAGLHPEIIPAEDTYDSGIAAGHRIAAEMPDVTAIYAVNEIVARGVLEGLRTCGKRVPEDISIIATDNTLISIISQPNLTTVCCDTRQMGTEAALLFLERIQNPQGPKQRLFLPPILMERDSVAAPPAR
jgi:DNA-binding LacI/PurR family transcriptional regulator